MAVQRIPQNSSFYLKTKEVDSLGKEKIISHKYSGVKTDAVDADIFAVAAGLAALQASPLDSIERVDDNKLANA